MADPTALGHIIEGVVERDPLTDHLQIMSVGVDGKAQVVDLLAHISSYEGKEVRLTLASFENLAQLAKMVEDQGGGGTVGVMPDDLPGVSFNIVRKAP